MRLQRLGPASGSLPTRHRGKHVQQLPADCPAQHVRRIAVNRDHLAAPVKLDLPVNAESVLGGRRVRAAPGADRQRQTEADYPDGEQADAERAEALCIVRPLAANRQIVVGTRL